MKLVIDRTRWLRGEDGDSSALLRVGDRKMCCLGFLAVQCGYDEHDLLAIPDPMSLLDHTGDEPRGELVKLVEQGEEGRPYRDTEHCDRIIEVNDAPDQPDREQRLANLFAEIGVEVEFVGGDS